MGHEKNSFIQEVVKHIKSNEAKRLVKDELAYHIKCSTEEWAQKGMSDEDAEKQAVKQMGSPIQLGMQFDKLYRPQVDWLMIILLGLALCFGFLSLIPAGYISIPHYAVKKMLTILIGAAVALGLMLVNYRILKKYGFVYFGLGISILLALQFLASRYIMGMPYLAIGPVRIESTMALPFLFLAWASFFENNRMRLWQLALLFFISLIILIPVSMLPTIILYIVIVLAMLARRLSRTFSFAKTAAILTAMITIMSTGYYIQMKNYVKMRFTAFLYPERDSEGFGYLYLHLRKALSSAGWFGQREHGDFLPEGHTDMAFVSITHYAGWLFAAILLATLLFLAIRMAFILTMIHDSFGKMLVTGAVALFSAQVFYNIGMSIGLLPLTSVSLPFISYGLMPTLINAFIVGLVLSVYRRKDLPVHSAAPAKPLQ
ncbi:FtsW/RodA/SpoVE family cell cycle protein [Neobacillus notoginsengisoli]|uniref:FtsW/RodA/SpoVE family cell cycle protein n=1 Tax=Neobacillus notoginsengisoli TaxID=1578198 RepID=A0A417YVX3_9BACI|nr:FtsW/RodA/SpoVE family cell cycle protein [Neobacillus notoginsengisoli]RHW41474.1 FtsW/RodA/SpoVE family cell cycle protein [Neobacillus notoginsengisoli]